MEMIVEILRCAGRGQPSYREQFLYTPESDAETVATMLRRMNEEEPLVNADGKETSPIRWQCGCLQKRCGACAMVINGRPSLACDYRLAGKKKLFLEPLSKFPVVEDLFVDRSIMAENLKRMQVWLSGEAKLTEKNTHMAFLASRCLQCGCCLEVCPNFAADSTFTGMAAAMAATRVLEEEEQAKGTPLAKAYRSAVYAGCGKSLACRDICPVGLPIDELLSRSNAVAVWGRRPAR